MPADTALQIAARMLMRMATVGAIGRIEKTRPRMTNSGLPGGCGRPSVYAAAMYSLVSHIAVDGRERDEIEDQRRERDEQRGAIGRPVVELGGR